MIRILIVLKNPQIASEKSNMGQHSYNPHLIRRSIVGKKFGTLTVLEWTGETVDRRTMWRCQCDCGNITIISRKFLSPDNARRTRLSCGCLGRSWGGGYATADPEELAMAKHVDLMKYRKINGKCWDWTGHRINGKTPGCSWKNKVIPVRRVMWYILHGIEYEPNRIYTTCGNLMCFNPDHLTLQAPERRHFYRDCEKLNED